jgi:HEAT repeat protein
VSNPPQGDALKAALEQLLDADVLVQNQGVEALIRIGKPAVPPLLSMLKKGSGSRRQVMYTLSQLGAPEAAEPR